MSSSVLIWLAADHHDAFVCGGWAYVRQTPDGLAGAAGGERNTTARRGELAGLAAALRGPDPHLPIKVRTSSPYLRKLTALLAAQALPDDAASTDLDLWAQLLTAAKGRTIEIAAAKPEPRTPLAFVAAWAELARDKAKATGAFTASIPKTNLAKVQGL